MPIDVRPARDYEALLMSVIEEHPEDAMRVLFGVELEGRELTREEPTEEQRELSRGRDIVFLLRHNRPEEEGYPTPKHDIYHVEVQAEREDGFREWLAAYWFLLAERYDEPHYRINQLVAWPLGGGHEGLFRRDDLELRYQSINVPSIDPARILSSPLATIALWPKTAK